MLISVKRLIIELGLGEDLFKIGLFWQSYYLVHLSPGMRHFVDKLNVKPFYFVFGSFSSIDDDFQ